MPAPAPRGAIATRRAGSRSGAPRDWRSPASRCSTPARSPPIRRCRGAATARRCAGSRPHRLARHFQVDDRQSARWARVARRAAAAPRRGARRSSRLVRQRLPEARPSRRSCPGPSRQTRARGRYPGHAARRPLVDLAVRDGAQRHPDRGRRPSSGDPHRRRDRPDRAVPQAVAVAGLLAAGADRGRRRRRHRDRCAHGPAGISQRRPAGRSWRDPRRASRSIRRWRTRSAPNSSSSGAR